jgi:methylglutaconyl-CoA hydratase
MQDKFNYILYNVEGRLARITLNRPEKRNALHPDVVTELQVAFDLAEKDENVKIILLDANGEAFCAGADLSYLQQLQNNTYEENLADSTHLKNLFDKIYRHPKVVVAQIEGHALAGGCGLASVCDFVFSVPEAKFGFTEVKIGFIPAIVMIFLVKRIGEGAARELLLTGNIISAERAHQLHLINQVYPAETIAFETQAFIKQLLESCSGESLKITKQMLAKIGDLSLDEAFTFAAESNAKARAGADCKRGIAAFLNKEKITW